MNTGQTITIVELGEKLQLNLTERELREIHHCIYYAAHLGGYGTAGHNQLMLIARLAGVQGFDVAAGRLRWMAVPIAFPSGEAQG